MNNVIITFYNELNYGAILQAYALHRYMNKISNSYVMNLDFELVKESKFKKIFLLRKKINFNSFKKKYIKNTSRVSNYNEFIKYVKLYDNAIVGSDQVWAYDLIKNYEDIFYLKGDLGVKKCSYSASFGKNENLINNLDKTLEYLKSFHFLSVRESSSVEMLNKHGLDCRNTCDPTLLLEASDYIENFNLKENNDKYILVYMLVIDDELVKLVNELNKILNLKIYCFNNKNRFGNKGKCFPNVSPEKFVELFYNASFVVTNSFHGTCFSIIFRKKFISVIHKTKGIRQLDLLKKAGLEDRVYDKSIDLNYYIKNDISVSNDFYEYIMNSKMYLRKIVDSNE